MRNLSTEEHNSLRACALENLAQCTYGCHFEELGFAAAKYIMAGLDGEEQGPKPTAGGEIMTID